MFDAGSDVIDWLAAIPWTGVGIGGSIVAAIAASAHFGRVMLIAWRRGRIREKLGEFLSEGQALSNRCANEKEPAPGAEAEDRKRTWPNIWGATTLQAIATQLDCLQDSHRSHRRIIETSTAASGFDWLDYSNFLRN